MKKILLWMRNQFWMHKWVYRNQSDRTCKVCNKHEVEHCSEIDAFLCMVSCWWEVKDEGDVMLHHLNGKQQYEYRVYGMARSFNTEAELIESIQGRQSPVFPLPKGTVNPEQFYRAVKEIIDRCVAPDMHANAMSMLERAVKEIG